MVIFKTEMYYSVKFLQMTQFPSVSKRGKLENNQSTWKKRFNREKNESHLQAENMFFNSML